MNNYIIVINLNLNYRQNVRNIMYIGIIAYLILTKLETIFFFVTYSYDVKPIAYSTTLLKYLLLISIVKKKSAL